MYFRLRKHNGGWRLEAFSGNALYIARNPVDLDEHVNYILYNRKETDEMVLGSPVYFVDVLDTKNIDGSEATFEWTRRRDGQGMQWQSSTWVSGCRATLIPDRNDLEMLPLTKQSGQKPKWRVNFKQVVSAHDHHVIIAVTLVERVVSSRTARRNGDSSLAVAA